MSTTNNTNNYTVKALVAKYRNFVMENAPRRNDRISDYVWSMEGKIVPQSHLDWFPDYQLIITLYNTVAGDKADKKVKEVLAKYADHFYQDALTADEFDFLCEHFSEAITELFYNGVHWGGNKEDYSRLFTHVRKLQLLKEHYNPQPGSTIYMCDSGCDVAALYPNCQVVGDMYGEFTDGFGDADSHSYWALGRIWLFSQNIKSSLSMYFYNCDEDDAWLMTSLSTPQTLNHVVYGTTKQAISLFVVEDLYNKLSPNGKMIVFTSYKDMASHDEKLSLFRQRLVADKTIASIISFKERGNAHHIMLVLEKTTHDEVKIVSEYSNKSIIVSSDSLDADILWPGYYIATKPKEGVSLSTIAQGKKLRDDYEIFVKETGYSEQSEEKLFAFIEEKLPQMFMVIPSNLSSDYKDANVCNQKLNVASNHMFDNVQIVIVEQPCVLLGISSIEKKVLAGYISHLPQEGIGTVRPISCLVPLEGIDVRYLCSLLLLPLVSEQIRIVCDGTNDIISLITDKIIVPNHNEKERLEFLAEANFEALMSSQQTLKQEQENFKKAVRMRKHALTQSLSSIQASFNSLNNYRLRKGGVLKDNDSISRVRRTTVNDVFNSISKRLEDIMPVMEHIADVEYSFGSSEWIDPEDFLDDYVAKNENNWLNFRVVKDWCKGQNKVKVEIKDPKTGDVVEIKHKSKHMLYFPKAALKKVLDNIVSNACSHGFTNKNCEDYQIKFSWEIIDFDLVINVENNGTPIPSDRDTASLLEYGVSSALHQDGHNGIGCNEIDDIMRRYEGGVHIVSTPDQEYTVKYVLSFQVNNIS